MSAFNSVVVENDELDRLMVVSCINKSPLLKLKAVYHNAEEALSSDDFTDVDVLFLDIDMPGLNGIGLRELAPNVPACIFITSYPEFALDSFSVETLDYIVKPLTYARFAQAVERLERFMEIKEKAHLYESVVGGDSIYIKEGLVEVKIKLNEIKYLEALKDYTIIKTSAKRYCVLCSLGNLLKEKGFSMFVRIHRSFAVKKDSIKSIGSRELVLTDSTVLPIGRSFRENTALLH